MAKFTASPIAMLLVSVLLGSVGQLMLKTGIQSATTRTAEVGVSAVVAALKAIPNPWVLGGFACYAISSVLWLMILRKVPLSTAYPMISLGYVVVVVLSALILKESVRWPTMLGLLLIVAGVSLIGAGLAGPGGK